MNNGSDKGRMLPNPVVIQRADPYVLRFGDSYYFTASHPLYDRIVLRVSATIRDLQTAPEHVLWTRHDAGPMSHLIWAPELHRIQGMWVIYFAAAPSPQVDACAGTFQHRIFALICSDVDPLLGKWDEAGQVDTGNDTFCLDATSFMIAGEQYLVWAQKDLHTAANSNLYIARMKNPWTLATAPVMISAPEFDWECQRFAVNEGPAVLIHGDDIFISYSASGTGPEYAVGLLSSQLGNNLLDPDSWAKARQPVFTSDLSSKQFGPGHNSFTTTKDGATTLFVYHCRNYTEIEGDPLFDPNRHARIGIIRWGKDGKPDFGKPGPDTRWTPRTTAIFPPNGRSPFREIRSR
jgi:GH43 family beta-xylosidase